LKILWCSFYLQNYFFFVFGRRQMMRILYFEDPLVFVLSSKLFFVVQI